jgi:8-oxo-dGTP pyrophosphatase MutT (NUDIX family)
MALIREAGAIIVRGDGEGRRVLLVTAKRSEHDWIFPKGRIEHGETAEVAALREAREEAGVIGRVLSHVGTLEFNVGVDVFSVQQLLVAHEVAVPNVESRPRAWLRFDEALHRLTFDDARSLLRDAWKQLPDRLDATSCLSQR